MDHSRNEDFNYLNYDKPKNSLTRLIDFINETYKARGAHLLSRCLVFSSLSGAVSQSTVNFLSSWTPLTMYRDEAR